MDFSLVLLVLLVLGIVSTAHAARYEGTMFYGCFESCDCKVQLHWDGDQVMYADFKSGETVWTAPLLSEVENTMSAGFYIQSQVSKERLCKHYLPKATQIDKNPTEEKAPRMLVYPSEEAELGKEITLYCYISHFYPPLINVTWTRNGFKVTEGVALSNPQPETDGTFSQLASLSFHPKTDDVLGCTVQHQALSHPVNTAWGETNSRGYLEYNVGGGMNYKAVSSPNMSYISFINNPFISMSERTFSTGISTRIGLFSQYSCLKYYPT
ncbi:H-2 class II histocompatibility antigen, A-Q alpha chain-like isoform X1 [Thunnus maccoyii]|uniref:H-2 class II histocompatibility antigen, A-Q alpha chain-like isoform X1 n=1 Tax=Thunnus maccoyii TaxID=8240 RepID=UPI001C4ADADE|nr:H-2 class II histocompatibility antigen, A-Q alpha chain-like isoform X1 [Thunnus maccoyii]